MTGEKRQNRNNILGMRTGSGVSANGFGGGRSRTEDRINSIKEYKRRVSQMQQAGRGPNDKTRSVFENIRMVFSHEVFDKRNRRRVDVAGDDDESHFNGITKVVAVDNIYHMSPKSVFFRDA